MPENPRFTEFLRHCDLRLDLEPATALGARMWQVRLQPGEFLFHQGGPCDHFFVVFDGVVEVSATSVDGQELVFTTLGAGSPIGEATIVSGERRTAGIRARDGVTLLAIDRAQFLRLAHDHPDIALAIAGLAAETLRRLSTRVEQSVFAGLDQRLLALLDELARDRCEERRGRVELRVTQQSLADRLGVSREAVNKRLGTLATAGLVELGRGRIIVLDPAELTRLAAD